MSTLLLMRQISLIFFVLSLCTAIEPVHAGNDYVPGEIIVRYRDRVTPTAVVSSLSAKGAKRKGGSSRRNTHFVKLPDGVSVEEALEQYRRDPDVLFAEPNYKVHALLSPNDTDFAEQWGLENTGQNVGPSNRNGTLDADIFATGAWDIEIGSVTTVIAVLDTGLDFDHEDLDTQFWENTAEVNGVPGVDDDGNGFVDDTSGWDFVNDDNNPDDDSVRVGTVLNNHGTHIAGIIGADTNNSLGVAGVNWNVQLMILKVLNENGDGTIMDITDAIDYVVDKGVNIINASWGLSSFSQELYDAIEDAQNSGTLVVASAGNTAAVEYPARYNLDNIISVTATGIDDELTDFGSGTLAAVDVEDVDLGAPGDEIYSTFIEGNSPDLTNYYWKSGTSQSAAFVSGVAGLLLSDDSNLTPDEIKARILNSVDLVTDLETVTVSGGRLNADSALDLTQVVIVPFGTGLNADETRQFTLDGDTALSWSSSNTAVGTINFAGLFTALTAGTTTLSAIGATSNPADITVYVEEVIVTASDTSLEIGQQVTLSAPGGTSPFTWTSNNTDILTVNNSGVVTGKKRGSTTVTARDAKGYFGTSESISVVSVGGNKTSGNCFIATAAFGSPLHRHVRTLQEFRDRYLINNAPGRAFVQLYYRYSPPIADWIAQSPLLRTIVRLLLIPAVLFGSFMVKTGMTWKGLFFVFLVVSSSTGWLLVRKKNRRAL